MDRLNVHQDTEPKHNMYHMPSYSDGNDERDRIIHALEQTRWNRTKAAELLGMTFRQLRYRIQKYSLDPKHDVTLVNG